MIKRFSLILSVAVIATLLSFKPKLQTPEDLLKQIALVDSFKTISNDPLFKSTYVVWFRMPLDHKNPNSPTFPLKAYYSHKDFNRPMVVVIDGYTMYTSKPNELTRILDANQLTIEHRFFDQSRPKDSIPWSFLNVRQAAADQHKIIEAFKPFYTGKWASTGISKSGQATIYHRRFYPKDVDVSVPYVAPLNFSSEEPRVYEFLSKVGTQECRKKIHEYQIQLFEKKKEIFPMFQKLATEKGWEFIMGLDRAYDLSVLEYSFAFWQWGTPCDSIPSKKASAEVLFKHFKAINPFTFFEEKSIESIRPFFFQAMTEIGMYGYEIEPFRKYLKDSVNITFDFTMPKGYKANFNPETMRDVDAWLKVNGNNILYIYGQNDAWSATAVDPGKQTNAVIMFNPGGSHSTRIKHFPEELRDSIYTVLEKWMEVDLSSKKSKKGGLIEDPNKFQII
ncbi:MAG: peptidase [Bacteroidales bacterium]|nr:MAG: peptidase [Bacteroidales bacterium]